MASFVARLRASAPKPEAITAGSAADATLAVLAAEWIALVGSALGDRATLPLLKWDAALDGAARRFVRDWYNARGRNRQAGADDSIDAIGDAALAYLARLRPGGAEGKTENPRFVDSGGNIPRDAPGIKSSPRADDFIGLRSGRLYR
ncbi:MAG TPA: hypothetical protein VNI01_11265 [Elusimicrobiota bacterium]|nr:hypothetical protein [Elusimicrobiota bacterium]